MLDKVLEKYEAVIGLEIHAQLATNTKAYSSDKNEYGSMPNTNISAVSLGHPGTLPKMNKKSIEYAVKLGLACNSEITNSMHFDRKNYFYPDLPQGYQISQLYHPIVGEGEILVNLDTGIARNVRVERIHLEQDAGKSVHDMDPNMSFVDLNRTGVALMEIVSMPDIRSPEEAAAYVTKLRQILRYLGTCDGNMQNGNMRADVNVSVCPAGQYEKFRASGDFSHLGTRCELKNMNSMRFIQLAIDYEARRQISILEDGGTIDQETRLYDAEKNETRSMRSKEEAHDYRYFPDPDLLPLEIEQKWVDEIYNNLPELPDEKKIRFIKEFNVTEYDASVLTADLADAEYFEKIAKDRDGKQAANWVINELFGRLNKADLSIKDSPISTNQLGNILDLISKGDISGKIAKDLFEIVWNEGGNPSEIVNDRGMKQVTDTNQIETAVDKIMNENPDQVAKAKENPKLAGWFVGQVMKATGGKANPKAVNEIIAQKLKN